MGLFMSFVKWQAGLSVFRAAAKKLMQRWRSHRLNTGRLLASDLSNGTSGGCQGLRGVKETTLMNITCYMIHGARVFRRIQIHTPSYNPMSRFIHLQYVGLLSQQLITIVLYIVYTYFINT